MNETIIIAGGTGFLGQVLETYFQKKGYTIKVLTRNPKKKHHIQWNGKSLGDWCSHLENVSVIINLSGKSVDCRYTAKNKRKIYYSRIHATEAIGKAIQLCKNPPKIWINSSTATIYKHSLKKEMTEKIGDIGNDFSMHVAKSWEKTFKKFTTPNTRKIILRTSIVLGKEGGAILPLKTLTLLGLGGKQGPGYQKVSWIHELDFCRAVNFLIHKNDLNGIFNLSVPKPTTNQFLMKSLRKVCKIPFGISHPKWLLKIGAFILGTETELVLKSRNVIPERLMLNQFTFKYPDIEKALTNLTQTI